MTAMIQIAIIAGAACNGAGITGIVPSAAGARTLQTNNNMANTVSHPTAPMTTQTANITRAARSSS